VPSRNFDGTSHMALGGKALGNGWHDQAARFAGMHGTTKAKRAQSGFDDEAASSEADLAHELEVTSARIAGLERRLGQETAATQTLREHLQLLAKQFDAAESRAAELENELAAAQERAARHDNESQSLQTSLDLAMAENARLSQRLDLSDCALEDACAELARQQAACAKATGERGKLAGEVFAANGKRLNETTELKDQLDTMSARALTAERLLADARECLQARIAENGATERSLAELTGARRDADNQIKQLQDLLCVKQCQLNELEQSRQELFAAMNALLKASQNRETALTQAEDRIEALTRRIAQLEAEAQEASRQLAQTQAQLRAAQRRRPPARRVAADNADDKARINWGELAIEFAKLVKLKAQVAEPRPAPSPTALLASTITF
jgi:chromosome segregation ATPase